MAKKAKGLQRLKFMVIDELDLSPSYRGDVAEEFDTESAALKRAKECAEERPGSAFCVMKATHRVICPVTKPEVEALD